MGWLSKLFGGEKSNPASPSALQQELDSRMAASPDQSARTKIVEALLKDERSEARLLGVRYLDQVELDALRSRLVEEMLGDDEDLSQAIIEKIGGMGTGVALTFLDPIVREYFDPQFSSPAVANACIREMRNALSEEESQAFDNELERLNKFYAEQHSAIPQPWGESEESSNCAQQFKTVESLEEYQVMAQQVVNGLNSGDSSWLNCVLPMLRHQDVNIRIEGLSYLADVQPPSDEIRMNLGVLLFEWQKVEPNGELASDIDELLQELGVTSAQADKKG